MPSYPHVWMRSASRWFRPAAMRSVKPSGSASSSKTAANLHGGRWPPPAVGRRHRSCARNGSAAIGEEVRFEVAVGSTGPATPPGRTTQDDIQPQRPTAASSSGAPQTTAISSCASNMLALALPVCGAPLTNIPQALAVSARTADTWARSATYSSMYWLVGFIYAESPSRALTMVAPS